MIQTLQGKRYRERTARDYSDAAHGSGGAPARATYIVSDTSGNGITAGKWYPVTEHRAWVYIVKNDNGHDRVFSMYSSTHAHGQPYDDRRPPFARVWEEV